MGKITLEKLKDMVKPFMEERREVEGVNIEGLFMAHSVLKDFIEWVEKELTKQKGER